MKFILAVDGKNLDKYTYLIVTLKIRCAVKRPFLKTNCCSLIRYFKFLWTSVYRVIGLGLRATFLSSVSLSFSKSVLRRAMLCLSPSWWLYMYYTIIDGDTVLASWEVQYSPRIKGELLYFCIFIISLPFWTTNIYSISAECFPVNIFL